MGKGGLAAGSQDWVVAAPEAGGTHTGCPRPLMPEAWSLWPGVEERRGCSSAPSLSWLSCLSSDTPALCCLRAFALVVLSARV